MAIVLYQDDAERLFTAGPNRLPVYKRAGRFDIWRSHPMNANTAVALAQASPQFGNRLREACDSYLRLIPERRDYIHDDDGNDVLLRDPYDRLRRCILQWKTFAGVTSSAAALLSLDGGCPQLSQDFRTSLQMASTAAVEEHEAWLDKLEEAVARIVRARTTTQRKRTADEAVPSGVVMSSSSDSSSKRQRTSASDSEADLD